MKTAITKLLNIKYPIVQGGMALIANAQLAAAVSEAGGLGLIAGGSNDKETVRAEIIKLKAITKKPFGLNIMLMSPHAADLADLVIEEKVPVVTTGAGSPGAYMEGWLNNNIKVLPVVASVALAKRMAKYGAHAVIAEGCEAGGHIGELTTMALVPQIKAQLDIPVIAAGGIANGATLAAAFMLGAEGVQCGTCFLVAKECPVHENYKQNILKAKDTGTIVTGRSTGLPVRSLKTRYTRDLLRLEKKAIGKEELELKTVGSLSKAVIKGSEEEGSFMAGQISGLVAKEATAQEIIIDMFEDAEKIMQDKLKIW